MGLIRTTSGTPLAALAVLTVGCLLFSFFAVAQRVAADTDAQREYGVGLELFQKRKYAVAQQRFEAALLRADDLPSIYVENAKYYGALSGLELFNPDGQVEMEEFVKVHSDHPKVGAAHFHLGKYHFTRKHYKEVTAQFALVDAHELDEAYLEEFYFKKGYAHFQQKQFDEAQSAFLHVVKGGKKYRSPGIFYSSYILYSQGKNDLALKGFKELESDALFGSTVPFYILQILYRQEHYEEVVTYGEPLLTRNYSKDKEAEVHRILGESYYRLNKFDNAVIHFEPAVSVMGGNRDDRYKLGYACYSSGQFKKAIGYLEQVVLEEDTMAQLAYYHMGDCHLQSNEKMEARNAFRAASRLSFIETLKEDALFNFAKLAYELSFDPYNEAVQAFSEYIEAHPNSERITESYSFLLKIYLVTKNYEAALNAIDRIPTKSPELKTTYQRVAYTKGTEQFQDLKFERAIHYFQLSEKYIMNPHISAQAKFWRAEAYERMNNPAAALEYYTAFISSPGAIRLAEYGMAYYGIGYVHFNRENYTEAATWFRTYVEQEKQDKARLSDAYMRIGDSYYLQRNTGMAIEFYDKAIKLEQPDADYAIFQLAVCYGIQGNTASKTESLKAMLENYPQTSFAADAKFEIAEGYFFSDNTALALEYFDQVITEHPNSNYVRKAKLNKGLVYYNLNEDQRALPIFKEVAETYPATPEATEALFKIQKIYIEETNVGDFERYMASKNFPDITKGALDTSYYQAAELRYVRGDLSNAIKEFGNYLEKFPNGFFAINAHFYRAESSFQLKMFEDALQDYDHVVKFAKTTFTEKSLLSAGQIYMSKQNYNEALDRFTELEKVAERAENLLESRIGLMQCHFALNAFAKADEYAQLVIRADKVPGDLVNEAHLISAKSALAQNDLRLAEARFQETLLRTNSEIGAEAMYNLAYIKFLNGNYAETEHMIFEMVNIFPNYKVWIAKAFILLADNYEKQGDLFQAKLTLQNVVDNYLGVLRDDAQRKLDVIKSNEPQPLQRQDAATFEVEFEQDGKVNPEIFEEDREE